MTNKKEYGILGRQNIMNTSIKEGDKIMTKCCIKYGKSLALLILALMLICLSGCHSKYCTVPGCPAESASGADYCYQHKCANFSCSNRAIQKYGYCEKCIKRATSKF